MLPLVIGISLVTTIAADVAFVVAGGHGSESAGNLGSDRLGAAAGAAGYSAVAPLDKPVTPHVLVASGQTLPATVVARVMEIPGVKDVETVDAARALVSGKRVGVMGVEPSTFRAFTPEASAKSDALWRNIAGGDVAVSFTMGKDGGIPLASWTKIGGTAHQT